MQRGGGVAGGGGGGAAAAAAAAAAGRGLADLAEHPPAMTGAPGFHWGAMIAGHHAAAAAGMMQPSLSGVGDYGLGTAHHPTGHPAMPMDLHVPQQAFPCYRFVLFLQSQPPNINPGSFPVTATTKNKQNKQENKFLRFTP